MCFQCVVETCVNRNVFTAYAKLVHTMRQNAPTAYVQSNSCGYNLCESTLLIIISDILGQSQRIAMTRHTSLAIKIHQFTCISTNKLIPVQENGNMVLAYRGHAVVDARCIVMSF